MNTTFIAVDESFSIDQIRLLMKTNDIEQVPIVDSSKRFLRMISERSLLGKGVQRNNAALILAGGKGTRLGPLTRHVPKPMLPIAGRPMIEHIITHLADARIRKVFISINYLGHKIQEHFGDGSRWGCQIEYLKEEQELGSGGPLKFLEDKIQAPCLVVNGDLVTTVDFSAFLDFHVQSRFDLTVGVTSYAFQVPYGVVSVANDGSITSVTEKPTHTFPVNAGLYIVEPKLIPLIPANEPFPMTGIIERARMKGYPVGAFMIHEVWEDVGLPAAYVSAQTLLKE